MSQNATADILVFRGVDSFYSYTIPDTLSVSTGHTVDIPFGKSTTKGLVVRTHPEHNPQLKAILSISDEPQLNQDLCDLIIWFKDYYLVTPFKAFQTIIGTHKKRPVSALPAIPFSQPFTLTAEQQQCVDTLASHQGFYESLLFGVTASGKTEIYIQLCKRAIETQKKAIILVPEIGLTPQFFERFQSRFGERVALIHSELTPAKRDKAWNHIMAGEYDIVIGPRSAVFSPFNNIGLIIIDEEHDSSYKQDNQPRYLTHDIARHRAMSHNALLVYGSATPSIHTFHQAKQGLMGCVRLASRVTENALPAVSIIDMKAESSESLLSEALVNALKTNLKNKEKSIILLNRRGYAPFMVCASCKKIQSCPSCNLSFTYHHDHTSRCHRCNVTQKFSPFCMFCKKPKVSFGGLGTQKVESELMKRFPEAVLSRLDRDTGKTVKHIEAILTDFKTRGDILIGTQMIAKGHDIPEVTLVGVLGIDSVLHLPDFGAPERVFQLLTQVSGRAGRGEKPGTVIVQSLNPEHYALDYAKRHDSEGFYEEDSSYREALSYPPFNQCIHIIFSGQYQKLVQKTATDYASALVKDFKNAGLEIGIIGPKPAPIEKIQDYFRWHILLKIKPEDADQVKDCLKKHPLAYPNVRLLFDVNARSVL